MDFDNNENITRRKFVKGVAGAAVCCACFSLNGWADSEKEEEDKMNDANEIDGGKSKDHLAAACGTYCGACPAYINRHGEDKKRFSSGQTKGKYDQFVNFMEKLRCDGCLSGGTLTGHCKNCSIRLCAANKQNNSRCSDCEELPCKHVTNLINMGNYPHRNEYLPNLAKIREMGVQEWVKYEEERWLCPKCHLPMSWYDAECPGCGEPRSKKLFSID
jgi:hypothetical protein